MGSSNDASFTVRPARDDDRPWITEHASAVGGEMVVSNGRVHHLAQQPAFVAERRGERLGFFSYRIDGDECEITAALSLREGEGVGTALLDAVADEARRARCRRLWLVTRTTISRRSAGTSEEDFGWRRSDRAPLTSYEPRSSRASR
jgi:GNAT superfamily N-acetyltransferase